ncbi:MAG: MurT ligase domain-containing protein [Lachnospiraceae bacterium]
MKRIVIILTILICKVVRLVLRLMGRGGTNLPGKLALKLCPDLLGILGGQVYTIIITGTNGKTTSTRMLDQCLKYGNINAFTNRSGANLITGITTEFMVNATWMGKMKHPYALIECDEAAFKQVSKYVDAKIILVTNIFRDQLDRYGEISHTINSIRAGIVNSPNATVCINADCSLSVNMMAELEYPLRYFAMETKLNSGKCEGIAEASLCPKCSHSYIYDYKIYGHLGAYYCPQCGFGRPKAHVAVTEVLQKTPYITTVMVKTEKKTSTVTINLPGNYNIYNAAGVITIADVLNLDMKVIGEALGKFSSGFGRMERFNLGHQKVQMILVKNPIGCSQALQYLLDMTEPFALAFCLNDQVADGTDISWIWDVDTGIISKMADRLTNVYCSGIRADDLAVWIKYSGVSEKKIHVEYDSGRLLETIEHLSIPAYILPTYTAMLALRDRLTKQYGLVNHWK